MIATMYVRPSGRKCQFNVTNIYPEDENWFTLQGVDLGFEDCGVFNAIYWTHPKVTFEDELDERTYIVKMNETCEDALHAIRNEIEKILKEIEND